MSVYPGPLVALPAPANSVPSWLSSLNTGAGYLFVYLDLSSLNADNVLGASNLRKFKMKRRL